MSLRLKMVLALTLLATAATLAIGVVSYRGTDHTLRDAVDQSLSDAFARIDERPGLPRDDPRRGDGDGFVRPRSFEQVLYQLIDTSGAVLLAPESGALPVGEVDLRLAAAGSSAAPEFHDVTFEGASYRMLTVGVPGGAVQLARSVEENEEALEEIFQRTLLSVALVALAAGVLGWFVARRATRRLEHLAAVAGQVASTGQLDVEVPVDGTDETGRLGRAFSGMLGALHASRQQQQQLVQDAGHELRTPLTSLRTNVSVLSRRFADLDADQRSQLLADLDSETRELTDLVNELVELATDRRDAEPLQEVRLADVVERAAGRSRRRTGREIVVTADDTTLECQPNAIERAVHNLVDNACKFASEGPIEVTAVDGVVTVRDHGPGLRDDDVPHLFDRFYRSVEMRSRPGSGLGLAIVKSIVERHGGEVFARNSDGGGAELGFRLVRVAGGSRAHVSE